MSNPTFPVRLAAASALSAGALLMTVSPALAQRAPEPNYAGPSTVLLVPAPTDSALDVRTPRRRRPDRAGRRRWVGRRGPRRGAPSPWARHSLTRAVRWRRRGATRPRRATCRTGRASPRARCRRPASGPARCPVSGV